MNSSVFCGFARHVRWCQIGGKNTRYTLYEAAPSTVHSNGRPVTVIVIPGNPGNDRFYDAFCGEMMRRIIAVGRTPTMFSISHANHVLIDDDEISNYTIVDGSDMSTFMERSAIRYNLDDQIRHKVDFCRQHLSTVGEQEIIFIGHSIGALICVRTLEALRSENDDWRFAASVTRCYALFPALENMSDTPQGRRLRMPLKFFNCFDVLTRSITFIVDLLPRTSRHRLAAWFIGHVEAEEERHVAAEAKNFSLSVTKSAEVPRIKNVPFCVAKAAAEIMRTNVIRNIIHMANHELDVVNDFHDNSFVDAKNCGTQITLFYTFGDGWSPIEYAWRMRQRISALLRDDENLRCRHVVEIDELARFEHAFVIRDSLAMAQTLSLLIFAEKDDTVADIINVIKKTGFDFK